MKNFLKGLIGTTLSLFGFAASAAVPLGVDTAITAAQADAVVVAGYVLIALAGLVAVKWMISIVRKA